MISDTYSKNFNIKLSEEILSYIGHDVWVLVTYEINRGTKVSNIAIHDGITNFCSLSGF